MRRESSGHESIEPGHEVCKVLLALGTQTSGVRDLSAGSFMVTRRSHVWLSAGNGGQLIKEVFENGGVGILAVEDVLGRQVPVVGVGKVSRVQHKVVVVNGASERTDGGVVQCRLDIWNVAFAGSCVAILTIYAELMMNLSVQSHGTTALGTISHQ